MKKKDKSSHVQNNARVLVGRELRDGRKPRGQSEVANSCNKHEALPFTISATKKESILPPPPPHLLAQGLVALRVGQMAGFLVLPRRGFRALDDVWGGRLQGGFAVGPYWLFKETNRQK